MNLFIDTNVVLDVLVPRAEFLAGSQSVWGLAESGQVAGAISTLSMANVSYVVGWTCGRAAARKAVVALRDVFSLVPLDAQLVHSAIDSGIENFEDAVQYFSALRAGADVLVTRNVKDFPAGDLPVQTPDMFLAAHFPES